MNLAEIDDTHLVAQLLLFCLRERFEPLFSWELHDRVLAIAIGGEISVSSVQSVVLDLPQANRAQLGRIVELLSQVVESASRNESTVHGLASVFAPVLCRGNSSAYMSIRHMEEMPKIRTVVQFCIEHYAEVFTVSIPRLCSGVLTPLLRSASFCRRAPVEARGLDQTANHKGAFVGQRNGIPQCEAIVR